MPQTAPKIDERDSLLEQIRTKVRTYFLCDYCTLLHWNHSFIWEKKNLFGSRSPSTWSLLWPRDLAFKVQKQIWSLQPSWRKQMQFARYLFLSVYFTVIGVCFCVFLSLVLLPFLRIHWYVSYLNRLWLEVMKMTMRIGAILELTIRSVLSWWMFLTLWFFLEPDLYKSRSPVMNRKSPWNARFFILLCSYMILWTPYRI